jgi:hypothetical protein
MHPRGDWNTNPTKVYLKLKPEFRDRMIKRGYNLSEFNKESMGVLHDLNRMVYGYDNPIEKQKKKNVRDS